MSTDATAQALVAEPTPPVTQTDADLMESIWDKANVEEAPETPIEPIAEQVEEAVTEGDEPTEDAEAVAKVEAPSDLPKELRDAWGDMPEGVRDTLLNDRRELNRKLAEQGRLVQGISPIKDVLVEAARQMPGLANMKPHEVAQQVFELARVSNDFSQKPVETMVGLIRKHGLESAVSQALQGQQPDQTVNKLTQHIQALERQLRQVADPDFIRQNFEQFSTQTEAERVVNEFAQSADQWAAVENSMPAAIAYVQSADPGLPMKDILARAYDLELQRLGKARPSPSGEEPASANPEQTERALKAKSVNVSSRSTGKQKALSEDQLLEQIWRNNQT